MALRFWGQGSLPTPETGTCKDGGRKEVPAASRSSAPNAASAVPFVCGDSAIRIDTQAAGSNIQAGSSSQRPVTRPSRLQRKVLVPRRSIATCTCTVSPNHGCQGYRTPRSSVTWAFCRRLLQQPQAPSGPRRANSKGLRCRQNPNHSISELVNIDNCERSEAIHTYFAARWIASLRSQ